MAFVAAKDPKGCKFCRFSNLFKVSDMQNGLNLSYRGNGHEKRALG